jgi:phage-related tail protein
VAGDVEKRITAKMVLDSSGFNNSLKGINQQLQVSQTELKASSAQVGVFGTTQDKLKTASVGLSKQIDLQSQKVGLWKDSVAKSTEKMYDNIKARDELKQKLQDLGVTHQKIIAQYGKESEEARQSRQDLKAMGDEYKSHGAKIESSAKQINYYTIQANKADEGLAKLQGELKRTNAELATNENKWIQAGKGMEVASDKMKKSGEKISTIGQKLSIGVTLPIIGIGVAATKMAMDAVESENLFDVSMGNMAESARQWSNDVSKSLGLNAYEVRKSVGTFNVMFSSMGQTEDAALKMSEGLTQLSYDMASFYNLKPEEAFDKLKSGISGEAEPLKALGILINDTTVEQYALANGIAKTTVNMAQSKKAAIDVEKAQREYNKAVKEHGQNSIEAREKKAQLELQEQNYQKTLKGSKVALTDTEKVQARYALIMDRTKTAQGDLARTMDSPTNKIRIQTEQIKQQAIELGTKLLPLVDKGLNVIKPIVDWFANLNDKQKEMIIKLALVSAAAGPVLSVGGKLVSTTGSLVGTVGKLSTALGGASIAAKGVGVAGAAAGTGMAGLGTALGGAALAAAPYVLVAGAVALAGYGIYKGLTTEVIPSVDLFKDKFTETTETMDAYGNKIQVAQIKTVNFSESTKKAVGNYMKMSDEMEKTLTDMYINSVYITDKNTKEITAKYKEMGNQIKAGTQKKYDETYGIMKTFYANSKALTEQEENRSLESLKLNNDIEKKSVDAYVKEINSILQKASDERRKLTLDEQQQINGIQEKMKVDAVKKLSDTELESKVILERLKSYGTRVTAEQAAGIIKNANDTRDKAVSAANQQYDKTVSTIVKMRDESHSITSEQADKLIKEATRQRDESINKAQELREGVVDKLRKMNPEVVEQVNLVTGKIKTAWDKIKDWWNNLWFEPKKLDASANVKVNSQYTNTYVEGLAEAYGYKIPKNASGTNSFTGGLTTLHEKGYEVYDLPRGTRIYNHEASEDMVRKAAEAIVGNSSKKVEQNFYGNLIVQDKNNKDATLNQLTFLAEY